MSLEPERHSFLKAVVYYFPDSPTGRPIGVDHDTTTVKAIPFDTRVLTWLNAIDFTAPIWVNGIALATYALARLTGWGALAWL